MVFTGEGVENDTLSLGSRKRKSKNRRSSILKVAKSPSRDALSDLDPNAQAFINDNEENATKKLRRSRRVSFAETYQVKEFVKDAHLVQPVPEAANSQPPPVPLAGLDSLLTGQIQNVIPLETAPINTIYEHPLPNVSDDSLKDTTHNPNETNNVSITMEMTDCYGNLFSQQEPDIDDGLPDDFGEQAMSPEQKIDSAAFLQKLMGAAQQEPRASQIYVPEKKFGGQYGIYNITDNTDYQTVLNTDLNKYKNYNTSGAMSSVANTTTVTGRSMQASATVTSSNAESTHIFDTDADMELTLCQGGALPKIGEPVGMDSPAAPKIDTRSFLQKLQGSKSSGPDTDKTRVFSNADDTANMDLTECGRFDLAKVLNAEKGDKTKIFDEEDNDGMELTSCVTFAVQSNINEQSLVDGKTTGSMDLTKCGGEKSFEIGRFSGEKTRIFNNDDSNGMELTTCVSLAQYNVMSASGPGVNDKQTYDGEKTRIFDRDDTDGMELTSCVSFNPPNNKQLPLSSSKTDGKHMEEGEKTRIFGKDDTDGMELTSCVSFPPQCNTESKPSDPRANDGQNFNGEKTRIFGKDDADGMELTSCVPADFNSKSDSEALHIKTSETEKTQIFGQEDDGMDLTACVSQYNMKSVPGPQANDLKTNEGVKTQSFGKDESNGMELTTCVSHAPQYNVESRLGPAVNDKVSVVEEKTQIFGKDDMNGMELTTCVSHTPQYNPFGSMANDKRTCEGEKTRIFNKDDTDGMELTSCVSFPPQYGADSQSSDSEVHARQFSDGEKTKIFGQEDTNGMELTSCVSSRPQCNSASDSVAHEIKTAEEKTKIFGQEDTNGMELTTCVSFGSQYDKKFKFESVAPGVQIKDEEKTRIFGKDDTNCMELTACVAYSDPKYTADNQASESHSKQFKNTEGSVRNASTCEGQTKTFVAENTEGDMEFTACVQNNNPDFVDVTPEISFKKSPEVVSALARTKVDEENVVPAFSVMETSADEEKDFVDENEGINGNQNQTGIQNGTFTLDSGTEGSSPDSTDQNTESVQQHNDSEMNFHDKSNLKHHHLSSIGTVASERGILDESDMDMFSNTSLEHITMPEDKIAMPDGMPMPEGTLPMPVETTEPKRMSLHNSTIGAEHTGSLYQSLSKSMLSVIDEKTLSSLGPIALEGNCSTEDFLKFVSVSFLDSKSVSTRRSTMAPISVLPPKDLSEFLILATTVNPELETMEWACNWLTNHIEKMQQDITDTENELSENNPPIFTEAQAAYKDEESESKLEALRSKMISLVLMCRRNVQKDFKGWRAKMVQTILDAVTEGETSLQNGIDQLNNLTESMDGQITNLRDVGECLDQQLRSLESCQLPTKQEIEHFKETQEKIEKIENELLEKKAEETNLKKTMESLILERDGLKSTLQSHAQSAELLSSQQHHKVDWEQTYEELQTTKEFVEWSLQSLDDYRAVFTFLNDTLVVEVNFGLKLQELSQDGKEHREVLEVKVKSNLADCAALWAHLCHKMLLGAVQEETLAAKYPTTAELPLLLDAIAAEVIECRQLGKEVEMLMFAHRIQLEGTNLSVIFSSLAAFVKFRITFHLVPGQYTKTPVHCTFEHMIGDISSDEVLSALSEILPGHGYLTRMIQKMEDLIASRIQHTSDNSDHV